LRIDRWRIGPRIAFLFVVVALVPIGIMGVFASRSSYDALLNQGDVNLRAASRATAQRIDKELVGERDYIAIVSRLPAIVQFLGQTSNSELRGAALEVLRVAATKSPDYESIAVMNPQGTIILSSLTN